MSIVHINDLRDVAARATIVLYDQIHQTKRMMKKAVAGFIVGLFAFGLCAGLTGAEKVEPVIQSPHAPVPKTTYSPHSQIKISGNAQFIPNGTNGVVRGAGTPLNPYII
jgi:hypothetical protein